jgi:hypothetical protein
VPRHPSTSKRAYFFQPRARSFGLKQFAMYGIIP